MPHGLGIEEVVAYFINEYNSLQALFLSLLEIYGAYIGKQFAKENFQVLDNCNIKDDLQYFMMDNAIINDQIIICILNKLLANDKVEHDSK